MWAGDDNPRDLGPQGAEGSLAAGRREGGRQVAV